MWKIHWNHSVPFLLLILVQMYELIGPRQVGCSGCTCVPGVLFHVNPYYPPWLLWIFSLYIIFYFSCTQSGVCVQNLPQTFHLIHIWHLRWQKSKNKAHNSHFMTCSAHWFQVVVTAVLCWAMRMCERNEHFLKRESIWE